MLCPDVDILVENHVRTDADSAVEMSEIIKPYNIMFMVETCTPDESSRFWKLYVNVPGIVQAGGERVYGKIYYAKPDQTWYIPDLPARPLVPAAALSEAMKIAAMADEADTGIQIHVCGCLDRVKAASSLNPLFPILGSKNIM